MSGIDKSDHVSMAGTGRQDEQITHTQATAGNTDSDNNNVREQFNMHMPSGAGSLHGPANWPSPASLARSSGPGYAGDSMVSRTSFPMACSGLDTDLDGLW